MVSSITTSDPQNKAKELLDAQAHIWNHTFSFLNSMALKSAIELGIPDAIHSHGKPITLTQLATSLPINPTQIPSLYRLMRLLSHSNFFSMTNNNGEPLFDLTINSQLLLKDHPLTIYPFVLGMLDPIMTQPADHLGEWFGTNKVSPFHVAHGGSIWEHANQVPRFNEVFNQGIASDARFIASFLVANQEEENIFEGIESLVDVGGGNGTMAKAIAKAYPGLKCMVFDLPHVVEGLEANDGNDNLVYVGGDMFQNIPPADVVLLKSILHDWSDELCVKILKQCKEAISKKQQGKVIIIDIVVQQNNTTMDHLNAQYLCDMEMMSVTDGGKERTEKEWKEIFTNAGFSDYKILPILGIRSVIEVYP